jgi:Tol biopolymer transport system component
MKVRLFVFIFFAITGLIVIGCSLYVPIGEQVLVFNSRRNGDAQLFRMNLDGTGVQQITTEGSTFGAAGPEGDRVVYESTRGNQDIFVADFDGANEVQLTDDAFADFRPVFSPTGEWIAFVSERSGNRDIWIIKPDGTELTQLTTDSVEETFPVFTEDGTKVLYTRGASNTQVYEVKIDGTGSTNLSNNSYNDTTPVAHPNGETILFASDRNGEYDLYTMDVNGDNQILLLEIAGGEFHPSYTVNGEQIVYYSDVSGNREIYIVDPEEGTPINLTNDPSNDFKTGTLIVY